MKKKKPIKLIFTKFNKKWKIVCSILVVAVIIGYASKHWLGADNFIEEACEEVIEYQTGYNFDLSF